MTWAKVDDQFHAHRKAKRAWRGHPRALGLHLLAISYCAGHLTDGFVDDEFVEEKVPIARDREGATAALVSAALWVREEDGWRINDWLDYNPSRTEVLEKRRRDSERKARGRRSESTRSPNGIPAESASRARVVPSRPVPTLPPSPPRGGRKRDLDGFEETAVEWMASVGVSGDRVRLVKAYRQAAPWLERDAAVFRAFCRQHFPSLVVEQEASMPNVHPLPPRGAAA